ncbi:transposase [Streptomyces mirabilis]|uniref:transposase n=1 Tax=Streptomyces mirabilis TaxID=68239 RepID=UPI00332DE885
MVTARRDHKVDLVGPILASTSWQTKDNEGFSQTDFTIDWDNRRVTCPNGKTTSNWREDCSQHGAVVVRARFAMGLCRPCEDRQQCTRADATATMGRRITLRPQAEQEVIQQARTREDTHERKEQYAHRAGVEGTISQGVRAFGLRRCRYSGLAKARLQHQLTATAMNFHRLNAWWTGIPRAGTRTSHLAALRP